MTFISIHSVIICVVFFGAYMRCTRLYPLNLGVTKVVSEEMLTVGWNLDRNGQKRLPLCNKYYDYIMTFISIHSVIICVVFFGAYMRCTRLYPLNLGVTKVVSEEMLTVGWNLDRNGQNHYLLTLLWFFLYLSWFCLTFCCHTLITLIFSLLRQDGFHTLESLWDAPDFIP